VRDRRGTEAVIGDRVFYVRTGGPRSPQIHKARVEDIDETRVLVRTAVTPAGPVTGNGRQTRWLQEREGFAVVEAGLGVTAAAWSQAAT
jgi:hypothetical protein